MATNLQKLREHRGISHEELAKETGVSAANLARAERGESDLSTEELFDLAVFFETGTDQFLDSDELAVTTQLDYPDNTAYDGFWGHVGILLPGHKHTKWYPVTTLTSEEIYENLQNYDKGFVVFRTLNNRVLFVNPRLVKKIMLNDDSADAPPDFQDIADYMAPVYYEALKERFLERMGEGSVPYSQRTRNQVEAVIENEKIDEEKTEDLLLNTFVYYKDGSFEKYFAEAEHLSNIASHGFNVDIPLISLPDRDDTFMCWHSGRVTALIDTPYLAVEDFARRKDGARKFAKEKDRS